MNNIIYTSLLLLSIISCTQEKSCKDLHEGKFGYTDPELSHIEILRTGDSQIEVNTETKIEAHTKIKWISDCEYMLIYEEFRNSPEELNFMIGKEINAQIIKIKGNKFTCQVKSEDTDQKIEFKVIEK